MNPTFPVGARVDLCVAHNRGVSWRSGIVTGVFESKFEGELRYNVQTAPGVTFTLCHPDSLRLAQSAEAA